MSISLEQFNQFVPNNQYAEHWVEALNNCLDDYEINTTNRIAAFLAQCKHESGNFTAIQENLNYKGDTLMRVWPSHFATPEIAEAYAHNPEKIANRAYASRMGNGPESSGDGWKFCGRGLIQLTGRDNYQSFADSLQMNIDDTPAYLQTFEGCVQSACFFWENNNLNALADAGNWDAISKKVNGGTLGLEERRNNTEQALQIFG